jgi:hypothetical protein
MIQSLGGFLQALPQRSDSSAGIAIAKLLNLRFSDPKIISTQ